MTLKTLKDLINGFKDLYKVAIIDRKEYRRFSYTYDELYYLCRKFAGFLKENKVKKGDRIIIWTHNGVEFAVVMLGSFLEGVIVVPVDLRSTVDFANKLQEKVKPKLVFQTRYKPKVKKSKIVFTEELLGCLDGVKPKKESARISENDVAQIIYTSGTTGEPKGVILTNKNLVSNLNALNEIESVSSKFRFLSVLPLSHVFEQMASFFLPLYNKSTIVYIRTLKSRALFEALREEKITHVAMVPRLLNLIRSGILQKVKAAKKEKQFSFALRVAGKLPISLRKLLFGKVHKKLGNKLEYFICGGAPLDEELENFYGAIGIPIVQGYGLTETSPVLTTNLFKDKMVGSVGKVVPGVKIKISVDGEILARGSSITQGYYKNQKKSRELFKGGWLRTGDLGLFDDRGFLFLKGRKKDIIVTSAGVNIYPEDIENVLNKIVGVKDSCVIEMETKQGEDVYAVLLLKERANAKRIVSQTNKLLDSSQQIKQFSVWPFEDFPRTTTMKVKKFVVSEFVKKKAGRPVIVEKKSKLYNILSKLSNKRITSNSTLQDLGLSSIDRVELVSLLEQEFNIEIDDEKVLPSTRVKDVENMVKARKAVEKRVLFQRWALSGVSRVVRFFALELIFFPLTWFYSWPIFEGKENLKDLRGPVIFASNHQSHVDTALILMSLPLRFSQKLAVSVWQEYFFTPKLKFKSFKKWALFYILHAFSNMYPFPQVKGFRKSMKYTGRLIDEGWSVLIFPEGARSRTGKMNAFKQGVGVLGVEMKVPVVPVKVENSFKVLPRGAKWLHFARVRVKIGKPIMIKEDSYIKATDIIENAVREL